MANGEAAVFGQYRHKRSRMSHFKLKSAEAIFAVAVGRGGEVRQSRDKMYKLR